MDWLLNEKHLIQLEVPAIVPTIVPPLLVPAATPPRALAPRGYRGRATAPIDCARYRGAYRGADRNYTGTHRPSVHEYCIDD